MKYPLLLVSLAICGVLVALPQSSEASAGYQLTDTTAVFFIDFTVTARPGTIEVPLVADHTVRYLDRVDQIGYEITTASGVEIEIDRVKDIVLSRAPLNDARYEVQKDTDAAFTIMAIVQFESPVTEPLQATITKLPFWLDGTRTTLHSNQLETIPSVVTVPVQK